MDNTTTESQSTATTAGSAKERAPKVEFAIQKDGKYFGLHVEGQLVAVTVYRKGATTLEALLRNCIKYSGRRLFRTALEDAMAAPEPPLVEDAVESAELAQGKKSKSKKATKGSTSDDHLE